ncbi:hypothetical protein [Agrobacterium pusense]|uniref:hypothetical protein n=1 Tax=Agrobacterium pusense TaxID=648995 RepID=UPI0031F46FA9
MRPDHQRRQQENRKHLRKDADDDGAAHDEEKLQQARFWTNDHGGNSKCLWRVGARENARPYLHAGYAALSTLFCVVAHGGWQRYAFIAGIVNR